MRNGSVRLRREVLAVVMVAGMIMASGKAGRYEVVMLVVIGSDDGDSDNGRSSWLWC